MNSWRRGADWKVRVLVVALVSVLGVASACSSTPQPSPTPAGLDVPPAVPSPTKYGWLFSQVADDGSVSKEVALKAFSMAIAPLPGVEDPPGDPPTTLERMDGTFAINWLERFRDQITPEQRAAMDAALAPSPEARPLAAAGPIDAAQLPLAMAGFPLVAAATPAVSEAIYNKALIDARLFFEGSAALNRTLNAGTSAAIFNPQHESQDVNAYAFTKTTPNITGGIDCEFHVEPELAVIADATSVRAAMAHEMFHCFQNDLLWKNGRTDKGLPDWIIEGGAEWAGEVAQGPSNVGRGHWEYYLLTPDQTLFSRNYSAMGFFEHLLQVGINPWPKMDQMLLDVDSASAFISSGADSPGFLDSWASGLLRDPSINGWWNEPGRWQTSVAFEPAHLLIAVGDMVTLPAKAVSNLIVRVTSTADVVEAQIKGHARTHGNLDVTGMDNRWFCTRAGGVCECPPGQVLKESRFFEALGPDFPVGVSGDLNPAGGTLTGHNMDEFCKPGPSPAPSKPCNAGCGGSNGDPHLRTIDGSRYDLQAAGEYVLLRSPDGSIEIQGRQEPRGTSATVNTAVAARVNGHRVAFYTTDAGIPEVRVDGTVVAPSAAASTDIGPNAQLAAYPRGWELDFPDGTKLWALSLGSWGINLLVLPSNELRHDGRGLIAGVPSSAQFRVPALPDGSPLPAPADRHDHYRLLYEVLAPAWRVTADTSLFDYDGGKTTDSFTVAGFPPETAPLAADELDPTAFAAAQLICGTVTDSDLADQCAFDVAVTGDNEYATLYLVSDGLESGGPATLNQPPPGTPPPVTPAPSGGPLPGDISFVADHLAGVSARLLAPNGLLYANVLTQAVAFGDVEYSVLAIDPATGAIAAHAGAAGTGMLAWAGGSLWAGEFSRSEIGKCQVSRLDPLTLAETASVPTVCGDQLLTVFTSVDDAIWFVDSTGAADLTGAHLRRIDPATNALDASGTGSVELPFLPQFVLTQGSATVWSSTSAGLIFGNRQHGLFRLLAGSDTFDPLGTPGIGLEWYAAGDGVWTETDTGENGGQGSAASFYNGGDQPTLFVGFDGYLAGADDEAIYVEYQLDTDVADSVIRYPADGSAPTTVAVGGFVANSFGGTTALGYNDSLVNPLLFSNGIGVKTWAAPTASDETMQQLLVQVLNLP